MFGTYQRLNVGAAATAIRVVRAARAKIAEHHRRDPCKRTARKAFYRDMLRHHARAQRVFLYVQTGGY